MTSWNAITPFSTIAGESDRTSGAGDQRRAHLDATQPGRPEHDPAPSHPLGFSDVRASAEVPSDESEPEDNSPSQDDVVGHADSSETPEDQPGAETTDAVTLPDAPQDALAHAEIHAAEEADESPAPPGDESPEPVASVEKPSRKAFARRSSSPRVQKQRGDRRGRSRVVGLKIGASQMAAAVVSETNGRRELLQLARTPLEPGIVVDGEVRDADVLTSALRAFFSEHELPTRDIRLGLASSRIGVRTFDIVGVDDESRFDNAVRFKAHEVLPVSVHDSVLDYRVLGERFSESGESMRHIFLVVAPKEQVQPYLDVTRAAGLHLRGIDLESLGLLRAFVEPHTVGVPVSDDRATVAVSIGHEGSTLLVAGGGACEFTRVFDWGGATLQDAIAQELDVQPAKAAEILRHLSLTGTGRALDGLDPKARSRALEAVRLRLTPFARELVSSLQFYQTQPDSLGIGEIVITGGMTHLEGLGEGLNQMIGVSVRVGDPLSRIELRTELDSALEESLGSLAIPIGLAIEDSPARSVNLIPSDARASSRRRPSLARVALPAAAAIPALAIGFFLMQATADVSERETRLAGAESELAALPVPKRPQLDPELKGEQAERALAVAQVLGQRLAWDAVLRDLSRVLPGDVSLKQLTAQAPRRLGSADDAFQAASTTAVPTATGVSIIGYTYKHTDVAGLIARLETVPSLQNVQLQSSTRTARGKTTVVEFTILADLREAGGNQ